MKVFIKDMLVYARHGVMQQEQLVGADFRVSVYAETEQESATFTDNLTDTISYADMAAVIRREMAIPSSLLEHAAGRMGRCMLEEFPILKQVTVELTKLVPPIDGLQCSGAGVEITVRR